MKLNYKTIILIAALAASGSCGRFTSPESELIGQAGEGPMRLFTADNPADSLFLRRKAAAVTRGMAASDKMAILRERMLTTVTDTLNQGVGIAAPQVGISRRMIAVQRFDKSGEPFEFYLNPEITGSHGTLAEGMEGCLSIPGRAGQVMRYREITVRYNDPETFDIIEETVSGYTAVIFQHEADHLDGILYTDRTVDN